ncbi:hypothetical protein BR93DRAFT_601516 [Coniochaeta sp. PMI_546]|nr:hypothetical protein BR93DRAFT_601516 [Coniochaeta sp. PMI_546]
MGEWKLDWKAMSNLMTKPVQIPLGKKRVFGALVEARGGSPKTEKTTQEWACLSPCLGGSPWFRLSSWTEVQTRGSRNFLVKVGTSGQSTSYLRLSEIHRAYVTCTLTLTFSANARPVFSYSPHLPGTVVVEGKAR